MLEFEGAKYSYTNMSKTEDMFFTRKADFEPLQQDLTALKNERDEALKRVEEYDKTGAPYKLIDAERTNLDRKSATSEYIESYLDVRTQTNTNKLYVAQCVKNTTMSPAVQNLTMLPRGNYLVLHSVIQQP
eukprot:UN26889